MKTRERTGSRVLADHVAQGPLRAQPAASTTTCSDAPAAWEAVVTMQAPHATLRADE